MKGSDFIWKGQHWYVEEEEEPHEGARVFRCCRFEQKAKKWWRVEGRDSLQYRETRYFTEHEIKARQPAPEKETMTLLVNAVAESAEKQGMEFPVPPFYCLGEGDDKNRCAIQCPFCKKV